MGGEVECAKAGAELPHSKEERTARRRPRPLRGLSSCGTDWVKLLSKMIERSIDREAGGL